MEPTTAFSVVPSRPPHDGPTSRVSSVGEKRPPEGGLTKASSSLAIRAHIPPTDREALQPDRGDRSRERERCEVSTSARYGRPKYGCAGRSESRLPRPFRIAGNTRQN